MSVSLVHAFEHFRCPLRKGFAEELPITLGAGVSDGGAKCNSNNRMQYALVAALRQVLHIDEVELDIPIGQCPDNCTRIELLPLETTLAQVSEALHTGHSPDYTTRLIT